MSTRIEPLGASDVTDVVALYTRDADRWRAEKAWRWRQRDREWAVGARGEDGSLRGFVAACPVTVAVAGAQVAAAQLGGGGLGVSTGDAELDGQLVDALVERLRDEAVALVYTAAADAQVDVLRAAGFRRLFELYARNLYVGLEKVSSRLSKAALTPIRRFAKQARRIRPKLLDVPLDEARVAELADLLARDGSVGAIGLVKDEAYLRWRYLEDPRADYRVMTYRSRAGQGVTAFALVRRFEPEGGRPILHVDEHWTRRDRRRDFAKLLGEVALVALSEECDAVRCSAAAGSAAEQALISLSCIRKKVDRHILVRALDPSLEIPDPFDTQSVRLVSGDLSLYAT